MASSVPGATGSSHSTSAPMEEMLRSFTSIVSPSMLVIARRISRCRGSRMHWKPSASTVTLLASSRAASASAGPAEDIALDHADPELADQLQIVMGLDALGAGIHAERFGKGDDGADDRRVAVGRAGRRRAANEALVDLDLVERRLLQIAERRIAGAEIVEREAHSERLQLGESFVGRFALGQEHAFGDLELEPVGADPGFPEVLGDHGDDRRIVELQRRQVDRDAHMVGPMRGFLQRRPQHPFADLADQAGFLGERHELGRARSARASGGCQRTSASKPEISSPAAWTIGW